MMRNLRRLFCICLGIALLTLAPGAAPGSGDEPKPQAALPPPAKNIVDFVRDIQPLFAKHCYECHGPKSHKSGLRLDRKAQALAGGDSGAAFEAGKSEESLLVEYVAGLDPDTVMPPEGKGERLSPAEVGLIRAWIDQGANWPDSADVAAGAGAAATHWAFQPVKRPAPPSVKDAWVKSPIDAFVLAQIRKHGFEPSPEADRNTLIRRLSLDLLGLPPTPAEVEQFVADESPDAYERLVDRLLANPHYGERWGRHWLDLARYADSDGYEKDSPRPNAWRFREWVIDALNRDLPFDEFTLEQLAGDLLPNATLEQKAATGFHRNTLTNREGGVDQEQFRVAAVVDRVNTTGTVWLGLTVGCAQCHTHKYDPILQREYYGLFAFFNSGSEVDLPAPLPAEAEAYAKAKKKFDEAHAPLLAAVTEDEKKERPARQAEWEKIVAVPKERWHVLEPLAMKSAGEATLTKQADGSILVTGINPVTDTYTITLRPELAGITALRLEVLDDAKLPAKGPGRVKHGNFVLTGINVQADPRDDFEDGQPHDMPLANASADFSQDGFAPTGALDDDPKTGWAVSPQFGRRHLAVFETKSDFDCTGGRTLTITLEQNYGEQHTIGRFRISAIAAPRPVKADMLPDDIVTILALEPAKRTEAQAKRLAAYHRTVDAHSIVLAKAVADHEKNAPKPPESKLQTLAENPNPPKTHIMIRGDFLRPGDEVTPHTLGVLPPIKTASEKSPTRVELARWLVSSENPLTARVTVNRVWRHLFGRGLVATPDDFGTRGEAPSHPELLDWLGTEFIAKGWSQKALIKEIVMSATYRQSSQMRPELLEKDPNNVWLARQSRLRLEAEVVRDISLASSGLLTPTIGGPSVRPPQPPGISELTYAGSAKWVESKGPDRYRRGLYTWFQRTSPYPMLMTFDAPDGNACAVKRERSNTPLQALTLLNDTVFVECAQALGRRMIEETDCECPDERIGFAFLACLARDPSDDEINVLGDLYDSLVEKFEKDPEAATKLLGSQKPTKGKSTPAEAAAWVAVGRAVMNLDEFVTRE